LKGRWNKKRALKTVETRPGYSLLRKMKKRIPEEKQSIQSNKSEIQTREAKLLE